ncbi:MAG: hypothetical protein WC471_00570 [Candidatus Woesearchaeota archaeon]
MQALRLLNVGLAIVSILLLLNLYYPLNSITGNIAYEMDSSEPYCSYGDAEISVDVCCVEMSKQLECVESEGLFSCYTDSVDRSYILNSKAYMYCEKEGYDGKIK